MSEFIMLQYQYLIWSFEHKKWWRSGGLGYTENVNEAGRFSFDKATRICEEANKDHGHGPHIEEAMVPVIWRVKDDSNLTYLWRDPREGRFQLGNRSLHCGDCFEVLVNGKWVQTRIEHTPTITHSDGWYIVTHPKMPLQGLAVKKESAP